MILAGGSAWLVRALSKARENAIDKLARTLYGEARGEVQPSGYVAVANVVMNRVKLGGWWGDTVLGVVLAKSQFSAWNANDPNRALIESVTTADPDFRDAMVVATLAIDGQLNDITGGATHYHTSAINPPWASSGERVGQIGNHVFYRGVA